MCPGRWKYPNIWPVRLILRQLQFASFVPQQVSSAGTHRRYGITIPIPQKSVSLGTVGVSACHFVPCGSLIGNEVFLVCFKTLILSLPHPLHQNTRSKHASRLFDRLKWIGLPAL